MRVLVTGAHGFLGSHITRALLAKGHAVRALVTPWGETHNIRAQLDDPAMELVRADLTDPATLDGLCTDVQAVVHAAARVADWGPWQAFEKTNVEGTRALLHEAVRAGAGRFVFISSVAVHRYTGFRNADTRTLPRNNLDSPYAYSKILAEDLLLAEVRLEPVIVRPGLWPFGQYDATFERVAHALLRGTLPLVRGGEAVLNTAYAPNFAAGVELAVSRPEAAGNVYVLADEGMPTWRELFAELSQQLGKRPPLLSLPGRPTTAVASGVEATWSAFFPHMEPPITRYRAGLMTHDVHFSIEHAREELGYQPKDSWRAALRITVDHYAALAGRRTDA